MVQNYAKGDSTPFGKNFRVSNFDCQCSRSSCTYTLLDDDLAPALDLLWEIVGPFKIDSGFRCQAHNAEIGGVSDSQHTQGKASDCKSLTGKNGSQVAQAAERVPAFHAGGIGTYLTFAHCDIRGWMARWKSGLKPSQIIPC